MLDLKTVLKNNSRSIEHRARLTRHMSNWVKVSDIAYSNVTTTARVFDMLCFELTTRQRPYIIKRLYSRYSNLRMQHELKEIHSWLKHSKEAKKEV